MTFDENRLALVPRTAVEPDQAAPTAASQSSATIVLQGAIGTGEPINLESVRRQISALNNPEHLQIDITSTGGNVSEARKIYSYLRALPQPISARIVGYCVSAAVIVFLAGSHRVATADSTILVHATRRTKDTFNGESFTAGDLRQIAEELEKADAELIELLCARTGHPAQFFQAQLQHEKTLSDFEALECGLLHAIESQTPSCNLDWAQQLRAQAARGVSVPNRYLTPNYFAACVTASLLAEPRTARSTW